VFADRTGNDHAGCDFRVQVGPITYEIEVKATTGDEPEFEMGSSELALAVRRRRGRTQRFVIAHVIQALSKAPAIRLLPNPYDARYQNSFLFRTDSGLTVAYRPQITLEDL